MKVFNKIRYYLINIYDSKGGGLCNEKNKKHQIHEIPHFVRGEGGGGYDLI